MKSGTSQFWAHHPDLLWLNTIALQHLSNIFISIKTSKGEFMAISALACMLSWTPFSNIIKTTLPNVSHLKGLLLAYPISSAENFEISLLTRAHFYRKFIGAMFSGVMVYNCLVNFFSGSLPVTQIHNSASGSLVYIAVSHNTDAQDFHGCGRPWCHYQNFRQSLPETISQQLHDQGLTVPGFPGTHLFLTTTPHFKEKHDL